jgi:hypothetical protein
VARDEHAEHHERPVPGQTFRHDPEPRGRGPAPKLRREIADSVVQVVAAEREPGHVVEGVAEMGELPVEQRRHAAALMQEVPRADVSVAECDVLRFARSISREPREGEPDQWGRPRDALLVDSAPEVELGLRRARSSRPSEARKRQGCCIDAVKRCERIDVAVHHFPSSFGCERV